MYFFQKLILRQASTICTPNSSGPAICNPLEKALHVGDIPQLISKLLNDLGGVIGLIAIALVVYAGFRMMIANGDKTQVDKAKKVLKYAVYGFVASVLAYAGVLTVQNFVGVQNIDSGSTTPQNPLSQFSNLKVFTEHMIQNVLLVIGVVSMLIIIVNGFRYLTARGNDHQVEDAKRGLTWAIAGLILSLFAYTIISAIGKLIS